MNTVSPIILAAGEGDKLAAAGVEITFKAQKNQTNGLWSCLEYQGPPQFQGPPPHYHQQMEEMFYVLEGNLTFVLDGQIHVAQAGSFVSIPPLHVHTFSNPNNAPARFLLWFSPGGFEGYFQEMAELIKKEGFPPKDPSKFMQLMTKYDTFVSAP
ncbi:MAG: cupin domain-containing protein [Spirosomataceae bacterium]